MKNKNNRLPAFEIGSCVSNDPVAAVVWAQSLFQRHERERELYAVRLVSCVHFQVVVGTNQAVCVYILYRGFPIALKSTVAYDSSAVATTISG